MIGHIETIVMYSITGFIFSFQGAVDRGLLYYENIFVNS